MSQFRFKVCLGGKTAYQCRIPVGGRRRICAKSGEPIGEIVMKEGELCLALDEKAAQRLLEAAQKGRGEEWGVLS